MAKAMTIKVGNPLRKLVLIKLADNANDKGECWPSYQHIADQCEISRSTVKGHVRALEEMGMLRREFRRNGELNQSNIFYLNLDLQQKSSGASDDLGHQMPEGGASDDPGGGASDDPITSHSFEPINEPIQQVANASCEVHDVSSKYAFLGNIIRLNHEHFQKWKALYRNIDLVYELNRLDIEFTAEKPKNWFITASQKLSYQNKQSVGRPMQKTAVNQSHWNDKDEWEKNFL